MQLITITGGRTLHGRIRPAAAKNSVLPLLAATLLCRTPSRLRAVPPLADVATSLALLQAVGAKAEVLLPTGHTVEYTVLRISHAAN